MIPQFIGAFLVTSIVMIGSSLLWPVVMKQDRPPVLQTVRDAVVKTEAGKKAEEVLGVYTVPDNMPQAVNDASSLVVQSVGTAVQKKVEEVVTTRVIEEVVKRFDTLPSQDKEEIKTIICKPAQ